MLRYHITLSGMVQGIGFRPYIYKKAIEHGLCGYVCNDGSSVFIDIEGDESALNAFIQSLYCAPNANILSKIITVLAPKGYGDFQIRTSQHNAANAQIPPDFAICHSCLQEFNDPNNRRYRYPFIACTQCGARASIIKSPPFERKNTSMDVFKMCALCEEEFHNPYSRRFHSELNSCRDCGVRISIFEKNNPIAADVFEYVASALKEGKIIALKGIGGFAFITSALNTLAINTLRMRKNRPTKPFAIMFKDMQQIHNYAICDVHGQDMLNAQAAPIVLLRPKPYCSLPLELLSPKTPYIGAILPYTALHHGIMQSIDFPIVFTSANLSGEPIASDDVEIKSLLHVYDVLVTHNLSITTPHDDSVFAIVDTQAHCIRRSRGYPLCIPSPKSFEIPILALGAQQKSSPCLGMHECMLLPPPLGDLSYPLSFERFSKTCDWLTSHFKQSHTAIADLHPLYLTHKLAFDYQAQHFIQHHYAHVLSIMAEHHLCGDVLGIVFDGSGYGLDGSIWGGEILKANEHGFTRIARLRNLALLGNEMAIKHPIRLCLSLLFDVYGKEALDVFPHNDAEMLFQVWQKGLGVPTSSMGRLFDAIAVLLCGEISTSYDGECGLMLENLCLDVAQAEPLKLDDKKGFVVENGIIDYAPLVHEIMHEKNHEHAATLFIAKIADLIVSIAQLARKEHGNIPVVLSGGVFCNQKLLAFSKDALQKHSIPYFTHHAFSPTDSSLALGQAYYAAHNVQMSGLR